MSKKAPAPCKHASNCSYTGCCAFVHPGEEGELMVLPGRTIKIDGAIIWQPPIERLVGSTFYERRRLRLSWPEWLLHNA